MNKFFCVFSALIYTSHCAPIDVLDSRLGDLLNNIDLNARDDNNQPAYDSIGNLFAQEHPDTRRRLLFFDKPGHTLIHPAPTDLLSGAMYSHVEDEGGSGVYGNTGTVLSLPFPGTNDRVPYSNFRRRLHPSARRKRERLSKGFSEEGGQRISWSGESSEEGGKDDETLPVAIPSRMKPSYDDFEEDKKEKDSDEDDDDSKENKDDNDEDNESGSSETKVKRDDDEEDDVRRSDVFNFNSEDFIRRSVAYVTPDLEEILKKSQDDGKTNYFAKNFGEDDLLDLFPGRSGPGDVNTMEAPYVDPLDFLKALPHLEVDDEGYKKYLFRMNSSKVRDVSNFILSFANVHNGSETTFVIEDRRPKTSENPSKLNDESVESEENVIYRRDHSDLVPLYEFLDNPDYRRKAKDNYISIVLKPTEKKHDNQRNQSKTDWLFQSQKMFNYLHIPDDAYTYDELAPDHSTVQDALLKDWWYFMQDDLRQFTS